MRVVVCHPGRQYSHELALALARRGMLAKYLTGTPAHAAALSSWQRPFVRRYLNAYALDIEPNLVEHHFVAPVVRKMAARVVGRAKATDWSHRADAMFDRVAARRATALGGDVVIAYENGAELTFQAAKRAGSTTVLDAASFHHAWQDRFYRHVESPAAHRRIVARKDREIELADYILTVSELARTSYLEAGISPERVIATPLGADLNLFVPSERLRNAVPVRFLFVGHIDERKGADVLREVAQSLIAQGRDFELAVAGKPASAIRFDGLRRCRHLGWLPQTQLAQEMQNHDVLVLPSRHDSFGMVVVEAMACGLPAIVSDRVGAKEAVTPRINGDIVVAGDATSLASSMTWFIENSSHLPELSRAATTAAQQYTWDVYGERVCNAILAMGGESQRPPSEKPEYERAVE